MRITEDIFWAHLQCNTKSYLKASGAMGEQRAFTEWEGKLVEDFQRSFGSGHRGTKGANFAKVKSETTVLTSQCGVSPHGSPHRSA